MPLSRRGWFDSVGDRRSSTKGWLRIAAGLLRLLICRFFLDRIEHRRLSGSTQGLRGLFRAPTHGLRRVEAVATRCEINRNECRIKTAAGRQTINTTYAWQNQSPALRIVVLPSIHLVSIHAENTNPSEEAPARFDAALEPVLKAVKRYSSKQSRRRKGRNFCICVVVKQEW